MDILHAIAEALMQNETLEAEGFLEIIARFDETRKQDLLELKKNNGEKAVQAAESQDQVSKNGQDEIKTAENLSYE